MSEKIRNHSRRDFMVAGSAAIVSPMLVNVIDPVETVAAEAKKANKDKIYYISNKCIGCHACKIFCPQKAVYYGVRKMEIDQDKCVQCGTCYNECPISVIEEIKL
jgi:NAD-dependent dihydropyrimidine dehydrogenase PreA subunit